MANKCIPQSIQQELFGEADLSVLDDSQILKMVDDKALDIQIRERQKKLEAIAIHRVRKYLDGQTDKKEAFKSFFGYRGGKDIGTSSVERHQEAVLGSFHAKLAGMMEQYKPTKLGFSYDKEGLNNMVRELFDQKTGDAQAGAFAKMFKEVTEEARARFNRAGGAIAKLDTWNLPQSHSADKLIKTGKEQWMRDIKDLIDRERITDDVGGKITDKDLDDALAKMYDRITNEFYDLEPGKVSASISSKMANRHREHRFIHFKDGDAWLEYHSKYSEDDNPFVTMSKHLDGMSMEIGLMEKMGPNPDATFKFMSDVVRKATNDRGAASGAEKIYRNLSGKVAAENHKVAGAFSTVRNAEVATKLGAATISATSDAAFIGLTAAFNGLPVMRIYKQAFKNLATQDKSYRVAATRFGITADYAIHQATTASRYTDVTGYGAMSKIADATMRASGMNVWTNTHKMTFKMEFLGAMADMAKTPYKDLNKKFRSALNRYGIDEADWKLIAKSKKEKVRNASYINPMGLDAKVRDKVLGMIAEESEMAIPSPNVRTKAFLNQGLQPGTVAGELLRTIGMFKSFPVAILMGHFSRGLGQSGIGSKMAYLSSMFVATSILGTLAYQAKEVSKGREPIDWENPKLWMAGMMQGGGLGIFGDFLFSDQTRFGTSLGATLAGPIVSDAEQIIVKYLLGSAHRELGLAEGGTERTKALTGKMLEMYTPGQLWYTRLAMQRYIFDNINKELDPNWNVKQLRLLNKRRKEFGNEYWWNP